MTAVLPRRAAAAVADAWDWAALTRPPVLVARLLALLGFAMVAWWRGAPAVLPAVLAFPLAEALVAWHAGQARHAFTTHDDMRALARHLRALGRRAVLAVVPPLLVASALLAAAAGPAAGRPLVHVTAARAAVGVLCAGGYGLVLLLAAARRLGTVLALGGLAVAGSAWPGAILGVYLAAVVLAAVALFDPSRYAPTAPAR